MTTNEELRQCIRDSLSWVIPLEHVDDATEAAYNAVQQFFIVGALKHHEQSKKNKQEDGNEL